MNFIEVLELLKQGKKIKRAAWGGYWIRNGDTIAIHCKDGTVLNIEDTKDTMGTLEQIVADDWEEATERNIKICLKTT